MRSNLSINGDRLWATIAASAKIGAGPKGGLRRLTLTDNDRDVRDLFASWAAAAGYELTVDQLGNMFVRREGMDKSLPPVIIGSHLDTQASGGRFDGILGVLGGFEVLRTLDDTGITTKRAIEVVNWTNEEGARFYPPMMSSLAFAGKATVDWANDRTDKEGRRFGDELKRIGYAGKAPGRRPQARQLLRTAHRAGSKARRNRPQGRCRHRRLPHAGHAHRDHRRHRTRRAHRDGATPECSRGGELRCRRHRRDRLALCPRRRQGDSCSPRPLAESAGDHFRTRDAVLRFAPSRCGATRTDGRRYRDSAAELRPVWAAAKWR